MKKLCAIILISLMVLSLAACAASQDGVKAPAQTESNNAQEVTQTEEPVVDEYAEKSGGVLHIAISSDANTMLTTEMRAVNEHKYAMIIYEGLFVVDGEGKPAPLLCESYEENLDELTYTLKLREGVKFHDGSDFNAEVCAWNLELYKAEGIQAGAFLKNLESVEVVDEYTVKLHLTQWDSLIPYSLMRQAGWMQSKVAYEEKGADYIRENPVGTGPFKFVSWERGASMTFERFDEYWQDKPYLDGVVLDIYNTDLVAQSALENGDVQVIWPTDYSIADYLENAGYVSTNSKVPEFNYSICFNCMDESSPVSDLRVRQAIAYAVDRDVVYKGVFDGHGVAVSQYGVPNGAFYSNDFEGYAYNPEKAKELLAEAGYPNGMELTIACQTIKTRVDTCAILKEQLAEVGITLNINTMETADFSTAINGWTDDMLLHTNLMANGPASQINANFRQNLTAALGITSLLHPDDLEAAIAAAVAADGSVSDEMWQGVQEMIFGDYCMLKSLITNYTVTVVSPKLHDANISIDGAATSTLWKAWLEK